MPGLIEGLYRVVRLADTRSPRLWLGLGLRLLERVCAIAPFLLGFVWLQGDASVLGLSLGLCGLLVAQLACSHYGQLNCFLGGYALMQAYRRQLLDHVARLPLGVLREERIGQLGERLTEDVKRIETLFTHVVAELLAALAVPLLFMLVLMFVDWRLTLALLATLPLAFSALNGMRRFFLAAARRKQHSFMQAAGLLVEFIAGLRTLRLFNRAAAWQARLDAQFSQIERDSLGVEVWGGSAIQLYRLGVDASLVVLLIAAGWLANAGQLSVLTWLLFALVAPRVLDPLLDVAAYLSELRGLAQAQARLEALLDIPVMDEPIKSAVLSGRGVRFFDVSLRYPQQQDWALRGVDLSIEPGQMLAIVGPSGAGKSSVLHLLARFYDPQHGRIELGGVDLRALRLEQLYDACSFVFQDVQLFDASVLDNLRLGRPDATLAQVMYACQQVGCHEFIQRLPQGYETPVGENGQRLSGGERQRLSIARALLKDAPILLLDEATASVDPSAQYEIQRALSRLAEGRTLIMVAHRLRTVRHADVIVVLDQGRIVERGDHATLLAQDGLYAELWRQQAG